MPEITHLKSRRRKHLQTHYELRGLNTPVRDGGSSWWLVYDNIDHPPELVGAEHNLPKHAHDELRRLRATPQLGCRRQARYIDATMCFFPGEDHNGTPHVENVDWLRQYKKFTGEYCGDKAYLVRLAYPNNEDALLEIWEHVRVSNHTDPNHLDAVYKLVWKEEEE